MTVPGCATSVAPRSDRESTNSAVFFILALHQLLSEHPIEASASMQIHCTMVSVDPSEHLWDDGFSWAHTNVQ